MDAFLGVERWAAWRESLLEWGWRLVVAFALVLLGFWIARRVSALVRRGVERRADDRTLAVFLENLAYFGLVLVVVVGALDLAGMPTASLLAAMGAAGLALGLALKDSLANVAAGVLLIVTRPFRVGDTIEAAGRIGTVLEIKLLQTRIVTAENAEVTMPNAIVMTAPVVNFTARPQRRLEISIPLAYDADAARALEVVREAIAAHPSVERDRPAEVVLTRVGAQGLDLAVRPWVKTAELHAAQSAILAELRAALARAGIASAYAPGTLRLARD
ncbi:MAG TPA: mechanosensitive ion channel domain-containing protein [Xanthomonadales bacterium]|nr:mechanosensitive ion channel domain-containing protein [Xanthomonadales bacterium]